MAAEVLTSHLDLLHALLARACDEKYTVPQTLQLLLWLCYRLLELDLRCSEAYLTLAWLFCLHQDPKRAIQLLLHAERQQAGQTRIQAMLKRLRDGDPEEAEVIHPLPELPALDDLLQELQQKGLPQDIQTRDAALMPIWKALTKRSQA